MPPPSIALTRRGVPLALLLAGACAHAPRSALVGAVDRQDCEAAAVALAVPAPHPAGDRVRQVLTAPAAWLVTGTAYATDFTVTAAGGLVAGSTLCLPLLALEAAVHGDGSASAQCVGAIAGPAIASGGIFGLGDGVAEATRSWRCLDHVGRVREVLAAAGCFAGRDWPGDRDVARALLLGYRWDEERFRCTPARERAAVEAALGALAQGTGPEEPEPGPPEPAPEAPAPDPDPAADQPPPPPPWPAGL